MRIRRVFLVSITVFFSMLPLSQTWGFRKADRIVVTWFVGLGNGWLQEQLDLEDKIANEFNKRQDEIELKLYCTCASSQTSVDFLKATIYSGNIPDIIGPINSALAQNFPDQWLDLKPLVEKYHYDLSQFPDTVVNLHIENDHLIGLPFAVYPGLIYYNQDLFDAARLDYPPADFGKQYRLDGKLVDWNWDTVAEVAKRLTFDEAGNNANNPHFDPNKIVQFGFVHQWNAIRASFSTFGGASVVNAQGKVVFPEHWRIAAKWLWNGIWKDHFIPNATYINSDLLKPNAFASGKVAMARIMLWYTCCLADLKSKWDLAVMPSYEGKVYAPADVDTFRIYKDSKNPDAAFKVLRYLQGDAAFHLLKIYGAYPARPDLQLAFIKSIAEKYPKVKNWSLVGLDYVVVPGYDSPYPNFIEGEKRFIDFQNLLYGDTGKDIDLNKELDKLESDLTLIVSHRATPKK